MEQKAKVAVLMVPFPAQSHLNQLLQLSSLISSYDVPVHYIASAVHTRQARIRANNVEQSKIHFHNLPTPQFASPSPNPNSSTKFPSHLEPSYYATLSLRQPFTAYLHSMSSKFDRIVVVHDSMMAVVVQDVASVPNAESYVFNAISAFSLATFVWQKTGEVPEEFSSKGLPPFEGCVTDEIKKFVFLQKEKLGNRAGDIYNTCRLIESRYLDVLANEGGGNRKSWAIGPILPAKLSSSSAPKSQSLKWLDEQEANSVIFVSFGTTVSMSDEEIEELALGLEQSKQKFFWVLRDADKGNIFEGEARRGRLPRGFEERVRGVGIVARDWAPQLEILEHQAIGGFMSHCGWNSCIESITMGVPIAAWPMHSDQPRNAMLVADILKVGLVLKEWSESEEVVKASRIESVVKKLMASEEGNEMRKRAGELALIVRQATKEGGVSRLELDSFIDHINREI